MTRADTRPLHAVVAAVTHQGWGVADGFFTPAETAALAAECLAAYQRGAFHAAGTGKDRVVGEFRGDAVMWVDETRAGPALGAALAALEDLRQAFNQALYLGLFDTELHFAVYPPGAGYQRHLDRFRDDDRRTLTVIAYLNPPDWCAADGGQLRFWPGDDAPALDITPTGGRLVCFLSDRFWHQVLPARRSRLSLTGWMRRR